MLQSGSQVSNPYFDDLHFITGCHGKAGEPWAPKLQLLDLPAGGQCLPPVQQGLFQGQGQAVGDQVSCF